MPKPKSITAKKLLLAEGRDAEIFLVWAARHFRPEQDFQVMNFGGITELTRFLLLLVNDECYDDVETIVVARDAETNTDAAIDSIQNSMKKANMPVPQKPFEYSGNDTLKTAFMIFSDSTHESGTLEDLCLLTVQDDPIMECVADYLECVKVKGEEVSHVHKKKLHCFLAGKDDYAGLRIGWASREGAWDFDHPALEPFKTIIQEM